MTSEVDPAELDALEETAEILKDRALMESIRRSREEAAQGERIPLESHG